MIGFILKVLRRIIGVGVREQAQDRKDFSEIVTRWEGLYQTIEAELRECRDEREHDRSRIAALERRVAELERELAT